MQSIMTLTINPAIDFATSVEKMSPVHKLRCDAPRRDPGGGGINVARVISRLGGDVSAIYPVGGVLGQLLHELIHSEGVRGITFTTSEETRANFTVTENATGSEYRFVMPGPALAEKEWKQCLRELSSMSNPPDVFVMSGSLSPGLPHDFYARVARIANEQGIKVVIDTSGPAFAAALAEGLYLIKPNLRELRELTQQPLEDEKSWLVTCRTLISAGRAKLVALSLGNQGALLVGDKLALRVSALPIKPVSSVGAGDSFLGAMVWALTVNRGEEEALRLAIAAASASLLRPGTELCSNEDVARLYPHVIVHAL